jgi:thioesterase domain-containing protein/acyl carrier protein
MIPSALITIDQWPLTSNGKLDRKRLAQRVREGAIRVDLGAATQQPRSAEELVISAAFADVLGVATVPMNESFFDLGGHSLQAVQLIALLNRRFDLSWQSSVLLESPTVERMAARLLDHRKRTAIGGIGGGAIVMNGGSAGVRPLWFFHPIGGTVFCYSALVRQLDPRRPVRAFEAPSLQDSLLAEVSVEVLAKNYAEQILELQPQGPYLLGGWCFGGVIAYEVAKQLTDIGHPIDAVILIDTRAPVLANHPTAVDDMKLLDWFVQDLARPHGKLFDMTGMEGLKPKEAMVAVHRQAANMSLISGDTDVSAIERSFNAFLAHGIALQTYLPQFDAALGFQLLLILAQDEPTNYGKFLGWDELVDPFSMQVKNCLGDHYTVMIAPNVTEVADIIEDLLPVQELPDLMLFSAKSDPL